MEKLVDLIYQAFQNHSKINKVPMPENFFDDEKKLLETFDKSQFDLYLNMEIEFDMLIENYQKSLISYIISLLTLDL